MSIAPTGRASPRLVRGRDGDPGNGRTTSSDGRAASQEGDRLNLAAVARQRRSEPGAGNSDQIAVTAIGQAAGAAGTDQVVELAEETGPPAMSS